MPSCDARDCGGSRSSAWVRRAPTRSRRWPAGPTTWRLRSRPGAGSLGAGWRSTDGTWHSTRASSPGSPATISVDGDRRRRSRSWARSRRWTRRRSGSAAALFARATGLPVSISSEIGGLGLLERENATVLNAALGDLVGQPGRTASRPRPRVWAAMAARLPHPERRHVDDARPRPPRSRCSRSAPVRPTACAARPLLSGRTDALVIDVGGTSADVGALVHGFPRESAAGVEIGGVQHELPHARSGLGAGRRRHDHRRRRIARGSAAWEPG